MGNLTCNYNLYMISMAVLRVIWHVTRYIFVVICHVTGYFLIVICHVTRYFCRDLSCD